MSIGNINITVGERNLSKFKYGDMVYVSA